MSVVLNLVRLSKGLVPRRAGYDTVRTCKFVGPTEWPWFDPDAIKNPATKKIENWASMQHDFPTESNDMVSYLFVCCCFELICHAQLIGCLLQVNIE